MPPLSPAGWSGNTPSRLSHSPLLPQQGSHHTGHISEGSWQQSLQQRLGRKGCVLGTQEQGQAAQGLCTGSGAVSQGREPTVSPCGIAACPAVKWSLPHPFTPAPTFVGNGLH